MRFGPAGLYSGDLQQPLTTERLQQAYTESHQELAQSAADKTGGGRAEYVSRLATPVEPLTAERLQQAYVVLGRVDPQSRRIMIDANCRNAKKLCPVFS